jgi:hypothetical protein
MVRPFQRPRVTRFAQIRPYFAFILAPLALGVAGCSYRSSSDPQESDRGAKAQDITFQFKTQPATPLAGETLIWDMKVLDKSTGKGFKSFADERGQRLKLAVVSTDNKHFQLVQPDYKDYGHFLVQGTFPVAGTYRVFAFFTPFGSAPQVKRAEFPPFSEKPPVENTELQVSSSGREGLQPIMLASGALAEDKMKDGRIEKSDGELRLTLQSASPRAGQETNLTVVARDAAGKTLVDLEPVLGAPAQMIILDEKQEFASSPALLEGTGVRGAPCVFRARFPRAGLYSVWTQFARRGETITVPFVLRIGE